MGGKNLKQTEFLQTDKKVMTSFHTDGIIFLIVTVRITSGKGFPMRQFLNKSFLILYSLLLLCPTNTDRSFVVGFFLAVFTAMTTFFFTSRRYACSCGSSILSGALFIFSGHLLRSLPLQNPSPICSGSRGLSFPYNFFRY